MQAIAERAQGTWDKFRKERDFHRMHHKRVVQVCITKYCKQNNCMLRSICTRNTFWLHVSSTTTTLRTPDGRLADLV